MWILAVMVSVALTLFFFLLKDNKMEQYSAFEMGRDGFWFEIGNPFPYKSQDFQDWNDGFYTEQMKSEVSVNGN